MKLTLPSFLMKGGPLAKNEQVKESRSSINPTMLWIGATVIFAALFFLSSVLDMRVNVTFGTTKAATTTNGSLAPATTAPSGIASQVGGC